MLGVGASLTKVAVRAAGRIPWDLDLSGESVRAAIADPAAWGETLGPELVVNGGFDSGTTGWAVFSNVGLTTPTTGLSVAGGVATVERPSAADVFLTQTVTGLVAGRVYEVRFDKGGGVARYSTLQTAPLSSNALASSGATVFRFTAAGTSYVFAFWPDSGQTATIDNISVREVTTGWLLPGRSRYRLSGASRTGPTMEQVRDEVLGPELVTNGAFAADVSGWVTVAGQPAGDQTIAWSAAGAVVTNALPSGASGRGYQQTITTVVGRAYRVSGRIRRDSGTGSGELNIGGAASTAVSGSAFETVSLTFVAAATTAVLYLRVAVAQTVCTFDDLTVREVIIPAGGYRWAAHNLLLNSVTAAYTGFNGAADNGIVSVPLPPGVPADTQVRQVTMAGATTQARFGAASGGTALAAYAAGVWMRVPAGPASFTLDINDHAAQVVTVSVGADWQFVSASSTGVPNTLQFLDVLSNNASSTVVQFCAPRMHFGLTPLPYVPTESAARFAPGVDWLAGIGRWGVQAFGARTNLALWTADMSNAAWQTFSTGATKVGAAAALGAMPMYRINVGSVGGSMGSASAVFQTFTATGATQYTCFAVVRSVSGSSAFRLSGIQVAGVAVGTGDLTATTVPQVFAFTWTTDAGAPFGANIAIRAATAGGTVPDIEVGGIVLCTGSVPASAYFPILTYGAAATRTADAVVAPVNAMTEGALVVEAVAPAVIEAMGGFDQAFASLNDGSTSQTIRLVATASSQGRFSVVAGGADQVNLNTLGALTLGAPVRLAGAFRANDFAASMNGAAVQTDTLGTMPTITQLQLGAASASGQLNGHILAVRLTSRRPQNGRLPSLRAA